MPVTASLPTHPSLDLQAAETYRSPLAEGVVVVVAVAVASTGPTPSLLALVAVSAVVVSATNPSFVRLLSFSSQPTDFGTR